MIKIIYLEVDDKVAEAKLEWFLHETSGLKFLTNQADENKFEGKTFEDVRTRYDIFGFALKDFTK